jgi:hypothetical protein
LRASILCSSAPLSAEIEKVTLLLWGCSTPSPPTTARSIFSRLPCRPSDQAKSYRITVVPAPLSMRIFPSRVRPFVALKKTLATGRMLPLSSTDDIPFIVPGSSCNS